ncbi:MAG TPA: methionine adenosyltransferase, partial [Candidatus Levybacteria bacterium]|nr:methionine adenosyltransferase [Candidatus Levybacteria bacterium]
SRVAVETLATINKVVIAGEVTTSAKIDYESVAREQIKRLGYTQKVLKFTDKSPIKVLIHEQSSEIAQGVDSEGAGDQGMMFGYACRETPELMPLPIILAHCFAAAIDKARETTLPYLRPDGKTQVTIVYKNGKPVSIESLVLAVPHKENIKSDQLRSDLYSYVVKPVLEHYDYSFSKKDLIINGTGIWHIGGPTSDTGVTGRKIVVDGYGGYARVGGGAFSGKDPTKVDRSGAYAARYIAKNIVAKGLADKAEVRLAYFIGAKQPLMQEVETFGTATVSKKELQAYMHSLLDTSVSGIINGLDLQKPIYTQTAAYGHFGRSMFPWETIQK